MTPQAQHSADFNVVIVGGGVGALESLLALRHVAGDVLKITLVSDRDEFVYRPMGVRKPFGYPAARSHALAPIAAAFEAEFVRDRLAWVDPTACTAHTEAGLTLAYDALLVATGTRIAPRFEHALTIDDRYLDQLLRGLIEEVEEGDTQRIAFVAAPRMAWPMPIYELALMTRHRASEAGVECEVHIVTPESSPLAIFGTDASEGVQLLLAQAGVVVHSNSYAEVPDAHSVELGPEQETLVVDRVVALPELIGPGVRGLPLDNYGFLSVDQYSQVRGVERVFAAGDVTDFPIKLGGIAAQQADAAAASIAALAGAPVDPKPVRATIRGILLTGQKPRYLTAQITGGAGFASQFSEQPSWPATMRIAAEYLGPYLDELDATA